MDLISNAQYWLTGETLSEGENNKARKVPVKIEPKVFFSNERTFLSWMNMSVTLSSISLAIIAFSKSNKASQVYGLCMLPVSIAFVSYSLHIFIKRAGMIRRKESGPYDTQRGPIILASILAVAIFTLFIFKLYSVTHR